MEHVKSVDVSLENKLASIEVDAATMLDALNMLPKFVEKISDLGFDAEPHIESPGY